MAFKDIISLNRKINLQRRTQEKNPTPSPLQEYPECLTSTGHLQGTLTKQRAGAGRLKSDCVGQFPIGGAKYLAQLTGGEVYFSL